MTFLRRTSLGLHEEGPLHSVCAMGSTQDEVSESSMINGDRRLSWCCVLGNVKSESCNLSDGKDEMDFVAIWLVVFLLAKTISNVCLSSTCGVSTRLVVVARLQAC
jgi:hypothetical protein